MTDTNSVFLNHNIYIEANPTLADVEHDAHAGGPTMFTQRIMTTHLLYFHGGGNWSTMKTIAFTVKAR